MRRNNCLTASKNPKKQFTFEAYNPYELIALESDGSKNKNLLNSPLRKQISSKMPLHFVQLHFAHTVNERHDNLHITESLKSRSDIIPEKTTHNAVVTEDFEYMERLLENNHVTQETRNYFGINLMNEAIKCNKLAVIHYLLQQKIKIPCNDAMNIQALRSQFVLYGDYGSLYRMGQLQIDDIDPNRGVAPIHLAVINNDIDMTKFLLFCRADVNKPDNFGNSALYLAVSCNNDKMVELLLKNNADPKFVNKQNCTAYDLVNKMPLSMQSDLIKLHFWSNPVSSNEFDDIQKAFEDGKWANDKILGADLVTATNRNDIKRVGILLNLITVENITKVFSQAVHRAIENGSLDLVKLFLQKCGNMSSFLQVFNNSETPIAHAIRANKEDIISFLEGQSRDIDNTHDYYGLNPKEDYKLTDNFQYLKDIMTDLSSAEIEAWFL